MSYSGLYDVLKFFYSFNSNLPYVLYRANNYYQLIKNPTVPVSIYPLFDGVYFTLLSGEVENPSGLNQNFAILVKNPNSLAISNSYVLRIYDKETSALLYETTFPSTAHNLLINYSTNRRNVEITIEANRFRLYTSTDYKNGYVPLNQYYQLAYLDSNANEIYRTFLFRNVNSHIYESRVPYRSVYSFSEGAISDTTNPVVYYFNNIVARAENAYPSEYKFPNEYLIFNTYSTYISSYSLLLSSVVANSVLKSLVGTSVQLPINLSNLPKNRNLFYDKYRFDYNSLRYVPTSSRVNIVELLLALYLSMAYYSSIDNTSEIDSLISTLLSFTPNYYPDSSAGLYLIPDELDGNNEVSYSLATNLLFVDILAKKGVNISGLLSELDRIFLSRNRKKVSSLLGDITQFAPLEAAILYKFLPKYFSNNSYALTLRNAAYSYLYQIEADISNNLVTTLDLVTDVANPRYNPIYQKNFYSSLIFYDKRTFYNLFIHNFLGKPIKNFAEFSQDKQFIIDSYERDMDELRFVLPSFRASITYFLLALLDSSFFEKTEVSEFVNLLNYDVKIVDTFVVLNATFSAPVKILALLVGNNFVLSYTYSSTQSYNHTIVLPKGTVNVSNYNVELYVVL